MNFDEFNEYIYKLIDYIYKIGQINLNLHNDYILRYNKFLKLLKNNKEDYIKRIYILNNNFVLSCEKLKFEEYIYILIEFISNNNVYIILYDITNKKYINYAKINENIKIYKYIKAKSVEKTINSNKNYIKQFGYNYDESITSYDTYILIDYDHIYLGYYCKNYKPIICVIKYNKKYYNYNIYYNNYKIYYIYINSKIIKNKNKNKNKNKIKNSIYKINNIII